MFLTFSNSTLLIGLAGAVVPLVLHLLSRARYESVEWGAMLFLDGLEARPQHTNKINQFALMLMRIGLVALLAIALAQPVLQAWGPEADSTVAALRVANRGQLLCLAGAIVCAAIAIGFLVITFRWGPRGRWGVRHLAFLILMVVGAAAAVTLGRRSAYWDGEVQRLMALQPQTSRPASDGTLRSRIDVAILLDCSSSMNYEENGHTRFSLAQSAAKQVLAGLHRGDQVSLLLLGQHQTEAEMEPTADLQSVADRIDAVRTGRQAADVAEGLLKAQTLLDSEGGIARDFYIICDRLASNWRGANDYFISRQWPDRIRKSSAAVRIFIVPVGNTNSDNLAVESIELADAPAIVGQLADLNVDVHNYGSTPSAAVPLTVTVNGDNVFDATVNVAPGQVSRVSVPLKSGAFAVAGSQAVVAEVRTSGYRDDDRLEAVVEAIEPIRVLVVSGDEWEGAAGQFRSESDFLRLALAPLRSMHRKGPDPCKVEVISEDQWSQTELQRYQVVVFANVERFAAAQAHAIEQYVYGGGGVMIAPGNLARVDNYNEQLWRGGAGILPAALEDATAADGSDATAIVGYDPASPLFQFLHDQPDLALSSTIGRYFPTSSKPSDARALAWYTSGEPFLIESHAGRGRVLLMTTSLDADWSTLPLSSFYLPYVQSAVRYLAAGAQSSRNLRIGDLIETTFDDSVEDHATVELPDGDQRTIPVTHYGAASDVRFTDTSDPGIYRVRVKDRTGEHVVLFAAHASPDQSDLTQLTDIRWSELEKGLQLKKIDPDERSIATVVAGSREGYDLWPWAVAAVLALGAFELALARFWSRDAY